MTQPTPGPSIQSVKWDGKFTVVYELSDGTSSAFRCVPAMGRLIAAAPELLEALKKYGIHRAHCDSGLDGDPDCTCGLDAAIRKAREG